MRAQWKSQVFCLAGCVLGLICTPPAVCSAASRFERRGGQFVWFNRFGGFDEAPGSRLLERVLTSPVILTDIDWGELIVSWNASMPQATYLRVEARAFYASGPTRFYAMGLWSNDPHRYPRESVPGQDDENGKVDTDTLVLKRPSTRVQVRVIVGGETRELPKLKFLGLALNESQNPATEGKPANAGAGISRGRAWGLVLPVPERSQMAYPNGDVLCSPTSLSMLLGYWAQKMNRPELHRDVPEISEAIYDAKWKGTGNWVFNTAYAGSFRGMRAYVARLSDVSELEAWIAEGVPVALSLCYDRLRGKPPRGKGSGHLVVCVGFTPEGDPILNDPGTSQNVQKVIPRRNLVSAWAYSRNAAYLLYPEGCSIPKDRFGHWASWTARQRVRFE